eukprot:555020-Amphidinium_carterae.4
MSWCEFQSASLSRTCSKCCPVRGVNDLPKENRILSQVDACMASQLHPGRPYGKRWESNI